jgi:hypothetical protein
MSPLVEICPIWWLLVVLALTVIAGFVRYRHLARLYDPTEVDVMLEAAGITSRCNICQDGRGDFGIVQTAAIRLRFVALNRREVHETVARRCLHCGHIELFSKHTFDEFLKASRRP